MRAARLSSAVSAPRAPPPAPPLLAPTGVSCDNGLTSSATLATCRSSTPAGGNAGVGPSSTATSSSLSSLLLSLSPSPPSSPSPSPSSSSSSSSSSSTPTSAVLLPMAAAADAGVTAAAGEVDSAVRAATRSGAPAVRPPGSCRGRHVATGSGDTTTMSPSSARLRAARPSMYTSTGTPATGTKPPRVSRALMRMNPTSRRPVATPSSAASGVRCVVYDSKASPASPPRSRRK